MKKQLKRILYSENPVCFKCGQKFSITLLHLHHLKPVRNGGKTTKANCVLLCPNCHFDYHNRFDWFLNKVKDFFTPKQYREHLKNH